MEQPEAQIGLRPPLAARLYITVRNGVDDGEPENGVARLVLSSIPGVGSVADFDRYVAEHNIPEEEWPAAFARWIAERTGGPAARFEKIQPATS